MLDNLTYWYKCTAHFESQRYINSPSKKCIAEKGEQMIWSVKIVLRKRFRPRVTVSVYPSVADIREGLEMDKMEGLVTFFQ